MGIKANLISQTFNYLTVISLEGTNKQGRQIWRCKCICGNETVTTTNYLRTGHTKSCGCYRDNFRKVYNDYIEHPEGYMVGITSDGREFIFDIEDLVKIRHRSWYISTRGYVVSSSVRLHRIITGAKVTQMVDHKNGNKLDNRKCNLRFASYEENNRNMEKNRKNCSSKYKGVHWRTARCKWVASITISGKVIRLGSYTKEEEAAIAYNKAAIKYFGEFARLNVIKDD